MNLDMHQEISVKGTQIVFAKRLFSLRSAVENSCLNDGDGSVTADGNLPREGPRTVHLGSLRQLSELLFRVDYCRPGEFKGDSLNLWDAPEVNAYLRPVLPGRLSNGENAAENGHPYECSFHSCSQVGTKTIKANAGPD